MKYNVLSYVLLAAIANGLVIPEMMPESNDVSTNNNNNNNNNNHGGVEALISNCENYSELKQYYEDLVISKGNGKEEGAMDVKKIMKKLKKHIRKSLKKDSSNKSCKSLLDYVVKDVMETSDANAPFVMAPVVNGEEEEETTTTSKNPLIPNRFIVVFKKNTMLNNIMFHKEIVDEINRDLHYHHKNKNSKRDCHMGMKKHKGEVNEEVNEDFTDFTQENEFGIASSNKHGGIESSFSIGDLFNGYVGYFTKEIIDLIRMLPDVEYVEQDSMVFANDFDTQNGAPWGLARISHREKLSLGSFNKYLFDDDAGKDVTAYVIDTGVNVKHEQFEGRATWGATIPLNDADEDGNGHGTHCAGTIGSKDYGVAKNAQIVAVKVLRSNGSGTMSDVLRGVEYAASAHKKQLADKKNKNFKGSTANMSLGGGKSPSLDLAVNAAVDAGIHFAVAAGNENQDACNSSPASAAKAITVGASTLSDDRAYFSNYGKCVDIFAPGLNVLSTYIGSDTATAVLSGTSMASPHVAGLLTYYLSLQPDTDSAFYDESLQSLLTPKLLKQKILDFATKDSLEDVDSETPNLLIYNGAGEDLSSFWSPKKNASSADAAATAESTVSASEHSLDSQFSLDSIIESISDSTDNLFEDVREIFKEMHIL